MIKSALTTTLLLCLASNAKAGPDGAFLCDSQAPYDFLTADLHGHQRFGIFRSGKPLADSQVGALVAGQGVKANSAGGVIVVPTEAAGKGQIELRKDGKLLKRIPGWLNEWAGWRSGEQEKFMFVVWNGDPDAPLTLKTWKTRYVADGNGHVLVEQHYEGFTDSENGDPLLGFSADGRALFELANEEQPTRSRKIFDANDLLQVGEVAGSEHPPITQLQMLSADDGYAIAGHRLHRVRNGRLEDTGLPPSFKARTISMDNRSHRILVEGEGDFVVMDMAGHLLFRHGASVAPGTVGPQWMRAKLAIDGSVAFVRDAASLVAVRTRQSGYAEERMVPLDADDWTRLACLTPRSAALMIDDKPVLVKF